MQDPKSIFPNDSIDVFEAKIKIAEDQLWEEGEHIGNGDTDPDIIFSKCLPHNSNGQLDKGAYSSFKKAIISRKPSDWASIPLGYKPSSARAGNGLKLVNPMASFSYELEGPSPFSIGIPASPKVSSEEAASDLVELYEMYLVRDIPFTNYSASKRIARAGKRLEKLTIYNGPTLGGGIGPGAIFRGTSLGDVTGPYISQFLLLPFTIVNVSFEQKYYFPLPGTDSMRDWRSTLGCQNGTVLDDIPTMDDEPRYISTARDLAWYLRGNQNYQSFLHALYIIQDLQVSPNPTNPYSNGQITNQFSSITFGFADVMNLISRVSQCILKAVSYHKWLVSQKIRPEAMAMIVERIFQTDKNPHDLHEDLLDSKTLGHVYKKNGNLLLPQVYESGAPCSPSYPSASAAVSAGVCLILKAFYDENWRFPNAYTPSPDGSRLVEEVKFRKKLTLGGELDKLVSNVSIGRMFAGTDFRSDYISGVEIGEKTCLRVLEDMIRRYPEKNPTFKFHLRDGSEVVIQKN